MNPRIIFLHIPKSAGTSQHLLLNKIYGRDNVFWHHEYGDQGVTNYEDLQSFIDGRTIVGGHRPRAFYPSTISMGSPPDLFCAIVREPVARAASLFNYYSQPQNAGDISNKRERKYLLEYWRDAGINPDSLVKSIESCEPFREQISNYQCHYLSNGAASFDAVLTTLHQQNSLIGAMDSLDQFNGALAQLLGWREIPTVHANKNCQGSAQPLLQEAGAVELIESINREDSKCYQFVIQQQGLYRHIPDADKFHDFQAVQKPTTWRPNIRRQPSPPPQQTLEKLGLPHLWQKNLPWPNGQENTMPWPLRSVLVSADKKIIARPIVGNQTEWLTKIMAELSEFEGKALLDGPTVKLPQALDYFNTGMMLKDYAMAGAREIISGENYYKFALLQDPKDRLVKAYLEAFVEPLATGDKQESAQSIQRFTDGPVSFAKFVAFICAQPAKSLDLAWMPQVLYLKGVKHYSKLYSLDHLDQLVDDLEGMSGRKLTRFPAKENGTMPLVVEGAFDMAPALLKDFPLIEARSFYNDELSAMVSSYYAEDCRCLEAL
ncbi:sulfotransferase family 2 domain-containing protein [Oceanicoccus sagamiensis]|uniref:Sulfotransferase family protein n=1 Tax=Oceanicoccus sagamiensis TaxID=716816 RepID=A0A1X9NH37_9GAMM|nr:sulfotransferase family 2 domain-containing protein [Oceanicoccus sagamiensis]ARN73313.1 hypothetical protein BST96_03850 [Oceanicoccus sagamiensis]